MQRVVIIAGMVLGLMSGQWAWADCVSDLTTEVNAACLNAQNANNDEGCKLRMLLEQMKSLGLYGTSRRDYVLSYNICDPNANNGQPCLDATNAKATHDVITLAVATDKSYVEAKSLGNLEIDKAFYQCIKGATINVVGVNNVIEAAPVDILAQLGGPNNGNQNVQNNNGAPPVMTCNSKDFACDNPLMIQPLSIGTYCKTSTFDFGTRERMLWIEGTQGMFILDSLTQKAISCQYKAPNTCGDSGGFFAIGKNEDGSNQSIIFEGADGKGSILNNAAAVFQKLFAMKGKALLEVVAAKNVEDCDALMLILQDDFKTASLLPDTEKVSFMGKDTVVKNEQLLFLKDKAILILKGKESGKLVGINVVTLKENADPPIFKPFPQAILSANYTVADEAAILSSGDNRAEIAVQMGPDYVVCELGFDATIPLQCVPQKKSSAMAHAKLGQMSSESLGSKVFGDLLADKLLSDVKEDKKEGEGKTSIVMHNIEGYGDSPNALIVTPAGARIYRMGTDGKPSQDADDVLPSAYEYILADLDHFGGKDLIGVTDGAMILLTKKNLPPKIEQLTLQPSADSQRIQAQATTKTQEGEKLDLKWQVFEYQDGKLLERQDLITNATTDEPSLNFPADSVATAQKSLPSPESEVSVGVSAALTKSLGAQKSTESSAQPVYFVALTATDPGGLSTSSFAAISKAKSATGNDLRAEQPRDANAATSLASMFALEGCSVMPNMPSGNFVWVLLIPLAMTRMFRLAYRRQ